MTELILTILICAVLAVIFPRERAHELRLRLLARIFGLVRRVLPRRAPVTFVEGKVHGITSTVVDRVADAKETIRPARRRDG